MKDNQTINLEFENLKTYSLESLKFNFCTHLILWRLKNCKQNISKNPIKQNIIKSWKFVKLPHDICNNFCFRLCSCVLRNPILNVYLKYTNNLKSPNIVHK